MTEQQPIVALDQKKVTEWREGGSAILAQAKELEIRDNDDFLASGGLLELIVSRKKQLMEFFKQPAADAARLHKFITNLRAMLSKPWEDAEELMRNRRIEFRHEQERLRLEREEQERAKAKNDADERAIQEAAELKAIGEDEAADVILERAATAPAPPVIVQSTVPKEAGISVRNEYTYRIVNADLIKREFLIPNESAIGKIVKSMGMDAMSIVGGIEVMKDITESIRTKR